MNRCENKHFACIFLFFGGRNIILVSSSSKSTARMPFLPIIGSSDNATCISNNFYIFEFLLENIAICT